MGFRNAQTKSERGKGEGGGNASRTLCKRRLETFSNTVGNPNKMWGNDEPEIQRAHIKKITDQ